MVFKEEETDDCEALENSVVFHVANQAMITQVMAHIQQKNMKVFEVASTISSLTSRLGGTTLR